MNHEDFCDILSDTSSTGFDDRLSPQLCLIHSDLQFSDQEFKYSDPPTPKLSEDASITYLCEICHKNIIKLDKGSNSLRKKRKRNENQLIVASMKVCEECRGLDLDDLKKMQGSAQCKRVIKREHAKRRAQEVEAQQEKQIDDNTDIDDSEKKKLKQVIRNRISAQQSRDRKKAYIREVEHENNLLKQQANALRHKMQQLHQENQYLKNQLAQIHIGSGPSLGHGLKAATLGMATLLSVFVLLNTMAEPTASTAARQLTAQLDLNQYKNSEGVSLQNISEEILRELQKEALLKPMESNSIVGYRKQRVDIINDAAFLKKIDPCQKKVEIRAMTTLFCPNVQAYWENENEKPELNHLQVIIPLESLPVVEHTIVDPSGQNYMLEIMCIVTDINVLPISTN